MASQQTAVSDKSTAHASGAANRQNLRKPQQQNKTKQNKTKLLTMFDPAPKQCRIKSGRTTGPFFFPSRI